MQCSDETSLFYKGAESTPTFQVNVNNQNLVSPPSTWISFPTHPLLLVFINMHFFVSNTDCMGGNFLQLTPFGQHGRVRLKPS